MRACALLLMTLWILCVPAYAYSGQLPPPPDAVQEELPQPDAGFLEGALALAKKALQAVVPSFKQAAGACLGILAVVILCGIFKTETLGEGISPSNLLGTAAISMILLQSARTFLRLGLDTVEEVSSYGELLLPVMSGALVASGGAAKASALYMGTAFCNSMLSRLLSKAVAPVTYLFLATGIAGNALSNELLGRMNGFFKSTITWGMKLVLYVFTGYMSITGAVSGATDAAALRATKLTISGMVPVVGGVLADASEAVLVGAGTVRSTVGVGGMLVVLALTLAPFLQVGVQYLLLKLTAAWCAVLGTKEHGALVDLFAQAMGMVLGMIGTCCLVQLISLVCFMKGVG